MSKQVAEVLKKALAAFGPNGENWARGWPDGVKSCAWTACDGYDAARAVLAAGDFATAEELWAWNDAPERTFADVKDLFEKAIEQELAVTA